MNAERRKRIEEVQSNLVSLQTEIEVLRDEEQEAYDNMPEALQQAERGEQSLAAIEALEEAIDNCESVDDALATAKGE